MKTLNVVVSILVILATGSLQAQQVVPGRWEKVDALPRGKQIVVHLKAGDRIEGGFKSSDPDALVVIDPGGSERNIPKSGVGKVMGGEKIKDSLTNGALIGLGVGLGVAVAALAAAAAGEGYVLPTAKVIAPLLGIGAGLGLGIAIDAGHQGIEVLFQAAKYN